MKRNDPFTSLPGVAGEAFINMHYADEIIENFKNQNTSKYVYKIVGLRGSGKSVELSKIISAFRNEENWKVYSLSAKGDPVNTLIAEMSKEKYINANTYSKTTKAGADGSIDLLAIKGELNGEFSFTSKPNEHYYSSEVTLRDMTQAINDNGYRILIAVDDISRTEKMIEFLSILGTMIFDDRKKVYFVCTGLSKNIEDFIKDSSLTFFIRSDTVEIGNLDKYEIKEKYQNLLHLDEKTATDMAKLVQGYAYAYQVLGSLYFNKKEEEKIEDFILKFDTILYRDSYDLIWQSLTMAEKELVVDILNTESGKVMDVNLPQTENLRAS